MSFGVMLRLFGASLLKKVETELGFFSAKGTADLKKFSTMKDM
jgi:hypothetical protein